MYRIRVLIAIHFFLGSVVAAANDQPAQQSQEDLELGRRYLQCTGFWGLSTPILKMAGQEVDQFKIKQLRAVNELAAFTLMGEDTARKENDSQKLKFVADMKSMGAAKALDSWSASCTSLMEETYTSIAPRVEDYAKAKRDRLNTQPEANSSK